MRAACAEVAPQLAGLILGARRFGYAQALDDLAKERVII